MQVKASVRDLSLTVKRAGGKIYEQLRRANDPRIVSAEALGDERTRVRPQHLPEGPSANEPNRESAPAVPTPMAEPAAPGPSLLDEAPAQEEMDVHEQGADEHMEDLVPLDAEPGSMSRIPGILGAYMRVTLT